VFASSRHTALQSAESMTSSKYGAPIRKCCRNSAQLSGTCRDAGRPGDRDEAAAHRFYGLLERGEKRGARHSPHNRIRHEAYRGRNFTAQRYGFELDVHTSIALHLVCASRSRIADRASDRDVE
jgi:hypothetical protein